MSVEYTEIKKTHFFHSRFVCFEREVTNSFFQGAILVKFWSFWCQLDRDSNSAQLLVNRSMLLILPCLSHHQTKLELYLPSSPSAIELRGGMKTEDDRQKK